MDGEHFRANFGANLRPSLSLLLVVGTTLVCCTSSCDMAVLFRGATALLFLVAQVQVLECSASNSTSNSNTTSSSSSGGGGSGPPMWLVGVLVSILGSIFSNMGQNIQKYAQNLDPDKEVSLASALFVCAILIIVLLLAVHTLVAMVVWVVHGYIWFSRRRGA